MFGWFQKKDKRDAYELGRRAAESMNADMAAFMARCDPFIESIGAAVFGDHENPDISPVILARIDLRNFVEHLDDYLGQGVVPEFRAATAEWADVAKQAGVTAEFERLIQHHLDQFKSKLVRAAFQNLLNRVDALKEADDKWRAANPGKAAQMPFDSLDAELTDLVRARFG